MGTTVIGTSHLGSLDEFACKRIGPDIYKLHTHVLNKKSIRK